MCESDRSRLPSSTDVGTYFVTVDKWDKSGVYASLSTDTEDSSTIHADCPTTDLRLLYDCPTV